MAPKKYQLTPFVPEGADYSAMNATLAGPFLLRVLLYPCVGMVAYNGASLIQTLFHRFFGHSRRIGKLYEVHVGGHHAQYAPQLLSDRWIRSEQHITWYYAVPLVMVRFRV